MALTTRQGAEAPRINLYSDTQTLPTAAMRQAMAEAPVGDEQSFADPSVNTLCERVAALLGKEAAVFLPSGTMCNEIAIRVHCRPGDEVIAEASCHILNFEAGGPAALSGVQIAPIAGVRGIYTAEQAEAAIRPAHRYAPRSALLEVENTANLGGGSVWPLAAVGAVTDVARMHGLATHLDGARLPNAVVASGIPSADYAACFDSAWIDLSKGLGCPVGAVLAGSAAFIDEVWLWKQRMGGAMRQAGILAAAGLHALDQHWDRLAEDHANAAFLANALARIGGVSVEPCETNILFFDVGDTGWSAADIARRAANAGLRIGAMGPTRMRAVTHLDVSRADCEEAAHILAIAAA
ncbi:MAG: threonine aldolase family protein [Alphaproteobacteria bacterium]|nr:threonine aldolase family protein [Alphaproteobacteria bacterium]